MYTLFLDTHSKLITISFVKKDDIFTKTKISERHSVFVLPLINEMLKEKNITLKDFNEIIVVNGPGSFTGIRIGLTIAKTISYSLNIPIYTLSSLKAYLLSSDMRGISVIEDPKGFYIGIKGEEIYTHSLEEYSSYKVIENKLDILKIVKYFDNKKPLNVHGVKANYVKIIEALK